MIYKDFFKLLKHKLNYNPDTGLFTWRNPQQKRFVGKVAGCNSLGYTRIKLDGKSYMAHRLAWLYMTGEWPELEVDHINRDKSDNRWCNLRQVHRAENMRNAGNYATCKSGVSGVCFHKAVSKWYAQISDDGKRKYLGVYDSKLDAVEARLLEELELGYPPKQGGVVFNFAN